jgi:hypothetical protein
MSNFDGEYFSEGLIIIILVALFFFGSTDIEDLSATPTKS